MKCLAVSLTKGQMCKAFQSETTSFSVCEIQQELTFNDNSKTKNFSILANSVNAGIEFVVLNMAKITVSQPCSTPNFFFLKCITL